MTDYNSMNADEYAQRLGEIDEIENHIVEMSIDVERELPMWIRKIDSSYIEDLVWDEARRRVMQATKERDEP